MHKKMVVIVSLIASPLLIIGGVEFFVWQSLCNERQSSIALPPPQLKPSVPNSAPPAAFVPATPLPISAAEQISLGAQIEDPASRKDAIGKLRALATSDPRSLSIGLPSWTEPLLHAKLYDDVRNFAQIAIENRSFDPTVDDAAQWAKVQALMQEKKYDLALKEAKSYYNIAPLVKTGDAIELLVQALTEAGDPSAAKRFRIEQAALPPRTQPSSASVQSNPDAPPDASARQDVFHSIQVDSSPYKVALARLQARAGSRGFSCTNLLAQGDLLLLSDQPENAYQCFEDACAAPGSSPKNLRFAVEGMAQSLRDIDGNVLKANAFITSLQISPSSFVLPAKQGSPTADELSAAAQQVVTAQPQAMVVPILEQQRARVEGTELATPIEVASDFEGATPSEVRELSPTHYEVTNMTLGFSEIWFMFRVHNVAGKVIRFDLKNPGVSMERWQSLNPMYSYVNDLGDLGSFSNGDAGDLSADGALAWNGPVLPSTQGQKWNFVENLWQERLGTISFVQKFAENDAIIAMRIPYTPKFNEHFFSSLATNRFVKVVEIERSMHNRPLLMAEIGAIKQAQTNPCALIYAMEHADETDAGWAANGLIEFLLSDDPRARQLRDHITFLVIPMFDPDASALGNHHSAAISGFIPYQGTIETRAYADWFKAWVDSGKRLDVVVDLHNLQSREGPQVSCPLMEGMGERSRISAAANSIFVGLLRSHGYTVNPTPWTLGLAPDRLAGWLSRCYGPFCLIYELNSQAPSRHLNLAETKQIGHILADAIGVFFSGADGKAAMASVDALRSERLQRWTHPDPNPDPADSAIETEAAHSAASMGGRDITAGEELIR